MYLTMAQLDAKLTEVNAIFAIFTAQIEVLEAKVATLEAKRTPAARKPK